MAILEQPWNLAEELDPRDIPPGYEPKPTDENALRLVIQDLRLAEDYLLQKSLPAQWDRDDRLYLFRMDSARWEGSSIPRANLGVPLVFEHIESLMPQLMSSIFSDIPPFAVIALGQTSPQAARAVRALVNAQLEAIGFQEQIRLCLKEFFTYGTMIGKYGWQERPGRKLRYQYTDVPEVKSVGLGTVLIPHAYPRKVKEIIEEYSYHEPWFERVHLRYALVDPALREPDVRKAKYVIHRTYPSLTELEDFRKQPGYELPSKTILEDLFRAPRELAERSRLESRGTDVTGISAMHTEFRAMPRWQDSSRDPQKQGLEMLEYTTSERVITVLNQKLCIKNTSNPLNRLNYLSASFADVLDSWYGLGVSKLLGGEQRLQQGIINSRLDDLALRLSGMFLRTRGSNTPTQQLRMRPGGIIDADDQKGVTMIPYPPAIIDAFSEVDASDARAQRRSGANQLITQGSAPAAGQLGRTSQGISTATAAIGAKIGYWADQISGNVVVPFLEACHEMNSLWMPEDEIKEFFQKNLKEEAFPQDPLEVKNAELKFQMLAGAKLQKRMAMLQLAPTLVQLLMAPPVLEAISDAQHKWDWVEFIQVLLDAAGWPGTQKFIVEMSEDDMKRQQEKQQMALQQNQITMKHQAQMAEIEQKGKAQAGVHIVKGMVQNMDPANRLAALQGLKDLNTPPGQDAGGAPAPPESVPEGGPGGGGTGGTNLAGGPGGNLAMGNL